MAPWSLPAARCMLVLLLALVCQGARADTTVRLFQSHVGNVNFVGTQETIRDKSNKQPCRVSGPAEDRYATLAGIPATATILSAQLYWAGSGYNPDFNVIMDGAAIQAPSDRRYYSTTIGNNYNYFSGAADVTAQVKLKRNNIYAFRGLTVDNNAPYCKVEGVLGGFSLLVIYADDSQPFRMLNLYEGFQYMRYSGITLNLSGFRVPDPIGTATGRVGHITWEGDATIGGYGENLTFNDVEMTDGRNPSGNQFNSRSNINGDDASYGVDFDAYTVGIPVIKSGQTTASTRYESGQDLVLLSAEVVALPNVPLSDLSLGIELNNAMTLGQNVNYTVAVSNKGPSTASPPTVVTTTLPVGLSFVSGAGTDWSCSSVGQAVTCSNSASIPAGSALPSLALTAKVVSGGTITVSATVSGKMYDPVPENNAANVSGTVSDGAAKYVFTDTECKAKLKLDAPGQCSTTLAPIVAGNERTIYLTYVSDDVPVAASSSAETMKFAIRCLNPGKTAGVAAKFAGKTLPPCAAKTAEPDSWSDATTLKFEEFSAPATFSYTDVGRIQLLLQAGTSNKLSTSLPFVSLPHELRITDVVTPEGTHVPANLKDDSADVIRAGLDFAVTVGAFASNGKPSPNFGQEDEDVGLMVPAVAAGASTAEGKAAMQHPAAHAHDPAYVLPALDGAFEKGKLTAKFKWHEVGVIKLTPGIKGSTYLEVKLDALVLTGAPAGRFIPHHFETATSQIMPCMVKMACAASGVDSAAYSNERFDVTVTARSESGARTMNYTGIFARDVTLSAWDKSGGDQKKYDLANNTAKANSFKDGVAKARPSYTLLNPYNRASPQGPWGAPDSIFVRAIEGGEDEKIAVSSKRTGTESLEGGIRIVNGRLLVPSAHGSERLNLPLLLSAQYWSGSNWELSSTDKHNLVDPSKASFVKLAGSLGDSTLTLVPSPALQQLTAGIAKFSVNVSPARAGSADLVIDDLSWLPSTKGRLKFGTYKSPLIYLRELH